MRRYYSKKAKLAVRASIAAAILVFLLLCYLHYRVEAYTEVICTSSCSSFGQKVINDAVISAMQSFDTESFVSVMYGDNGKICGITANNEHINIITAQITEQIADALSGEEGSRVLVPAGTFSGISFLGGVGPDIKIAIFQVGSPDIEIVSTLESAGVNQSVYKLYANIRLELSAVMPTKNVDITVERQLLISETVIIGEVPDVFAQKTAE